MKKLGFLTIFFVFILVNCSISVGDLVNDEKEPEITGMAKVFIPLPETSNARAIILEDAKKYTDFFEVSFLNKITNTIFSASATIDEGYIEAIIPPGTYDILLFAGARMIDEADGEWMHLLASSYAIDVVISLEETNIINLVLSLIDLDIVVPSKVIISKEFTVDITVNTKNPLIETTYASMYYRPNSLTDQDEEYIDLEYVKDGNIYAYSVSLSAPPTAGIGSICIIGHVLLGSTWWYYSVSLPIYGSIVKNISFVEGAYVNINITWPE